LRKDDGDFSKIFWFFQTPLVPDKLNSVLFWQKIENPHWGRAGRNSQFSIVNIQLKTSMIKTLNLKLTFLFWLVQVRVQTTIDVQIGFKRKYKGGAKMGTRKKVYYRGFGLESIRQRPAKGVSQFR
jgi:hypothetical protein